MVVREVNRSIAMGNRLFLLKWVMILIPPVAVAAGHLVMAVGPGHRVNGTEAVLLVSAVATGLVLLLSYGFVETVLGVLRRLQTEAVSRDQDILTLNAVMRERDRLGRELHDGAAQLVAHLLLRLDTIDALVETGRPRAAQVELDRLRGVAEDIYRDIGESIAGSRTDVTEHGLVRALRDYADQFDERYRIPVQLEADEVGDRLSPLAAFQLFRFVQEALTNVRKHADARGVTITLSLDGPDSVSIVVADDGQGFVAGHRECGAPAPLGLQSMQKRVEELGGIFRVDSRPGAGTRVSAKIPRTTTIPEGGYAAGAAPPR